MAVSSAALLLVSGVMEVKVAEVVIEFVFMVVVVVDVVACSVRMFTTV